MLDLKLIRSRPEYVREALTRRGDAAASALDALLALDARRRELLTEVEKKRSLRNTASEQIARARKAGADAGQFEAQTAAMRELGAAIKELERQLKEIEAELERELLQVPNLPDPTAPAGGEEN